jgi:hypothetical protein
MKMIWTTLPRTAYLLSALLAFLSVTTGLTRVTGWEMWIYNLRVCFGVQTGIILISWCIIYRQVRPCQRWIVLQLKGKRKACKNESYQVRHILDNGTIPAITGARFGPFLVQSANL